MVRGFARRALSALLWAGLAGAPAADALARDLHVAGSDPAASDENDGSQERPWKTISHAASEIQPGDTVRIRGGVYRERVLVDRSGTGPDAMLAFRAAPGEKVVVKGSEVLTGWTRCVDEPDRAIWETDWPWEGIFPSMIAADERPLVPMSIPPATEDLKPPKAYCQYYLGFGRGREAMVPGSSCYDETRRELLVWLKGDEDPKAHVMEAAVRGCWESRGDYILVEGISFQYCPLVVPVGGVVFVMCGPGGGGAPADGCIVRNCEVSLGSFEGMVVRGGKRVSTVVEDCWVHHNGNGCGSFEGQGDPDSDSWLIARRCRLTSNNLFNWNPAWHAGGKHFGSRVLFQECEFARNYNSPGLWFDIHERDCIVDRCHAHQNGLYGLYYEIGETGAFTNNLVEGGPHYSAVALMGSSRTLVAHNAVSTGVRGVTIAGDGEADGQVSRVTCYNTVINNVLLGRDSPLVSISPEQETARSNTSDHNLLWQSTQPADQQRPFETTAPEAAPMSLDDWQAERHLDLASRVLDPRVEVRNGRFTRLPDSPADTGGRALTLDDLRAMFAVQPMPEITSETGSSSIREHQAPSAAFVRKVAELLHVPQGDPVPVGPLPVTSESIPVSVANPDFEQPTLPANGWAETVPEWTAFGEVAGPRIWHAAGTGLWNWYMPSGDNVLVLPAGEERVGVTQTLDETLRPNTRYRLSAWTGQRVDQASLPWPHVELSLWAGEQRLGSVDIPEPTIKPHYGVWVETALVYRSPAEGVPASQLRVSLDRTGSGRVDACFDDVRLVATAG